MILLLFLVSCNNGSGSEKIKAAVICTSPEAAKIGIDVLKKGGNAFDAAVAVGFAMAVAWPSAGNIGGGGFLVGRTAANEAFTIDYREKAPMLGFKDMFLDEKGEPVEDMSTYGYAASGVPGSVDGMWRFHQKYGSLPWKDLVQPAIDLAENGFEMTRDLASSLNYQAENLSKTPEAAAIFTKTGGFVIGDRLIQKNLANTLRKVAEQGRDGFYTGEVAEEIARSVEEKGGFIRLKDLEQYEAKFRDPIRFNYRGYEIISMPPPSSGGTALYAILKSFERYNPADYPYASAEYIQLFTEICRQVYADRSEFLGDPDFYEVPMQKLLSDEYISMITDQIKFADQHLTSEQVKPAKDLIAESTETTHWSIVDEKGNMVSNTTTLNGGYGAKVVAGSTGFLLNNEMDDFSIKPGVANMYGLLGNIANAIEPGKRMLSSMTPTLILKDGKPFMTVGSPGGSRIITIVAQAIIRVIDYNYSMNEAVNLARIHHQWLPDEIQFERGAMSFSVAEQLKSWGYELNRYSSYGDCHGILFKNDGNLQLGISTRSNGAAEWY
ncbi:MAG: gamma-glutamyltransferase [Calditrichaeota bacterium]|nr:gamma-glutamyltransferase [Calditrichota bacterium]